MMSINRGTVRSGFEYGLTVCLILLCILSLPSLCRADDAMVLPKGRWMSIEGFEYYPGWDKQYNNQGDSESLALDYNRELNAQVFPDLAAFEDPALLLMLGLPPTFQASLGRSIVEFDKEALVTNVSVNFGITEKLSIGLKIPYWSFKTKVKSAIDPNSASLTWNPFMADPTDPFYGYPFTIAQYLITVKGYSQAQVDALKLTRDDVINLLSQEFGYKRFETWSDSGIGDMEIGLKYQYFTNEKWRLALQVGGRLPTGQVDDPDNLVDYGFGGGNYDIVLGLQNDYMGFKDFVLNGTLRYTTQLPDKETLRIPAAVDLPLTDVKEKVDRDLGDILELEFSASYKLSKGFGLNATYGGFFKDGDSVEGSGGHYQSLEDETSQTGHTLLIGAAYSNLERFQQKLSRVPYQVSLSHWQRFAGKNMNEAQYISFKAALFF